MKRNNVIFGAFGIVAVAAAFVLAPWKSMDSEGAYEQSSLSGIQLQQLFPRNLVMPSPQF